MGVRSLWTRPQPRYRSFTSDSVRVMFSFVDPSESGPGPRRTNRLKYPKYYPVLPCIPFGDLSIIPQGRIVTLDS